MVLLQLQGYKEGGRESGRGGEGNLGGRGGGTSMNPPPEEHFAVLHRFSSSSSALHEEYSAVGPPIQYLLQCVALRSFPRQCTENYSVRRTDRNSKKVRQVRFTKPNYQPKLEQRCTAIGPPLSSVSGARILLRKRFFFLVGQGPELNTTSIVKTIIFEMSSILLLKNGSISAGNLFLSLNGFSTL